MGQVKTFAFYDPQTSAEDVRQCHKLKPVVTVYTAELTAIYESLKFEVESLCIKAHAGIIEDQMADEAAKLGCESMEVLDHFLIPGDICKSLSRSV
ncbi:hypothetical protein QE152_g6767 [Popillia japonica]|uniref:Uncharacterized protein n=1 Tax=Popillia japonica TaxID=7064 RepID=A0AAW1MDL1_POPJA